MQMNTRKIVMPLATALFACAALVSANAQDTDIPNRADPLPGITTAGQPSADALKKLADQGYKTVIDLRGLEEDRGFNEASTVENLGMSYIQLPIGGASDVTYDNATMLHEADKVIVL